MNIDIDDAATELIRRRGGVVTIDYIRPTG